MILSNQILHSLGEK